MRRLSIITVSISFILLSAPAFGADLAGLKKSQPALTQTTNKRLYDLERCMIEVDAPIMPIAYRQPDRPDRVTLVWDGNGGGLGGISAAVQVDGLENARITFWGRDKVLRRITPCFSSI